MVRLLIVDDELKTREGIHRLFHWPDLGIDEVKTSRNGSEALDIIKDYPPDIVLTDVKMPKMNGIELAEKIRCMMPECMIIFLSAYSDKEYLKSAIHLNAIDYIEKPIDPEEVRSALLNAVNQHIEARNRKKHIERISSSLNESQYLIRQEAAAALLNGSFDTFTVFDNYGDDIIGFSMNENCARATAAITFNWKADENEIIQLQHKLVKLINQNILFEKLNSIAYFYSFNILAIIMENKVVKNPEVFAEALEKLNVNLKDMFEGNFTISTGWSRVPGSVSNISEAFNASVEASMLQFYYGEGRVFQSSYTQRSVFRMDKGIYNTFRKHLEENMPERASELVRELTSDIMRSLDGNIGMIKNIYSNLYITLLEVSRTSSISEKEHIKESRSIWDKIGKIATLRELSDFIISEIYNIYGPTYIKDAVGRKIFEIIRYIQNNYGNSNLSTELIAGNVYLSRTYICGIFKRSMGKTLNDYITEIRIEKAKELLKDSKVKLYEIASRVGYSDANYFTTIFKKQTGYLPSEYRERVYL